MEDQLYQQELQILDTHHHLQVEAETVVTVEELAEVEVVFLAEALTRVPEEVEQLEVECQELSWLH